jgi:hypothetical protein
MTTATNRSIPTTTGSFPATGAVRGTTVSIGGAR